MTNKTNFFDGTKYVPAHVGFYERMYLTETLKLPKFIIMDYWDGINWIYDVLRRPSLMQSLDWRGLKEKTK